MAEFSPVKRALLSVSDKVGIVDFAKALAAAGIELISTGGTARALRDAGLAVEDVSSVTNFPEMMDGRVKTLHPSVHGGLLALRDNAEHVAAMAKHNISPIDLLVVNLYPFESTVSSGADYETCVENIDIGGPAMIRAASKNHASVGVVTDPGDYALVLAELSDNAGLGKATLKHLAAKAYARTAAYDSAIANWMAARLGVDYPDRLTVSGTHHQSLRYGENPHQTATFYSTGVSRPGVATAKKIQGKELSYNNLNDTDAAYELIGELGSEVPAVAIIKHANPCGVARSSNLLEAYEKALMCDPVSAFGGIIALNQKIDAAIATKMLDVFTEVIIAPDADEEALAILKAKKNIRVLLAGDIPDPKTPGLIVKPLAGGLLAQSRDNGRIERGDLKIVTRKKPSDQELSDMIFAFRVAKHVKSNAIVYAKDGATVGIGAGQMSRVDSSRIAVQKSKDSSKTAGLKQASVIGSVVASDAFFPFADGLLAAAEAGSTAVIQPGGSMRDDEVIAAADEAGLAMVFTGMRHFRH